MSSEAKIVLLGSQSVGKTSLVLRYVEGTFQAVGSPTIGASFFTHKLTVDGTRVKLQLWDTAGQERFRSMAPMYYRGASAALLVYDVTSANSLEEAKSWAAELQRNTEDDTLICLLANKIDLSSSDNPSVEAGREYATSIDALFYETSAKDGTGINEAFISLVKKLLQRKGASGVATGGTIRLQQTDAAPSGGCSC
eukprot:m.12880 g.12880  ORF g.12880 m.12880 type:complete len:196 (+) comp10046_c0_seq2:27-614(+)